MSTNHNLLVVVSVSFYTLTKGITPKICCFCLVLMNSVLLNLSCVWILHSFFTLNVAVALFPRTALDAADLDISLSQANSEHGGLSSWSR